MAEPLNTSYKITNVRKYQSESNRRDRRRERRQISRGAVANSRQAVIVRGQEKDNKEKKDGGIAKRTAGRWILIGALAPLAPVQLFFGFVAISGLVAEIAAEEFFWGIFAGLIPGLEAFAIGYAASIFIGFISMTIAYIGFLVLKKKPFAGNRAIIFMLCVAGYFSVLLSWIPWAYAWVFVVLWTRK